MPTVQDFEARANCIDREINSRLKPQSSLSDLAETATIICSQDIWNKMRQHVTDREGFHEMEDLIQQDRLSTQQKAFEDAMEARSSR